MVSGPPSASSWWGEMGEEIALWYERQRLIAVEVKATGLGKYFPFLVTDLELRCLEDGADRFRLHRVFEAGRKPRLYVLSGPLGQNCKMHSTLYRATLRTG